MPSDRPSLKHVWANQPTEGFTMSPEKLRAEAERFSRQIRGRNRREYAASAAVIVVFGAYIFVLPGLLVKIGSLLVLAGLFVVLWQLHRRANNRPLPADASSAACAEYLRAELIRQRDALLAVGIWYLAPFVPGVVVMLTGMWLRSPHAHPAILLTAGFCVAVFAGIWALNRWAARRLQERIDALTL